MALSRNQRLNLVWAVIIAGGAVLGFTLAALDQPLSSPVPLSLALSATVAFCLGGSIIHWRLLDEAQREAHKTAWFWGGSMGMLVGLLVAIAVMALAPDRIVTLNPGGEPDDYLRLGIMWILLTQAAGYGLAWLFWWWSRR